MVGDGLVAEEVFTVQAATELLQKAKHIVDAVDHREAEKVLLPVERGCKSKTRDNLQQHPRASCTFPHI